MAIDKLNIPTHSDYQVDHAIPDNQKISALEFNQITSKIDEIVDNNNEISRDYMSSENFLDSNGKIRADKIEALGLTTLIEVSQTSLASFAANSANYTFEQNDIIAIPDGTGNFALFIYKGGTKTVTSNYLPTGLTNIDNLQIGGRNLILNSKKAPVESGNPYNNILQLQAGGFQITDGIEYNKFETSQIPQGQLILSFKIHRVEGVGDGRNIRFYNGSAYEEIPNTSVIDGEKIVTHAFNNTGSINGFYMTFLTGGLEISWMKLEKGNKATDWTPAPEDKQDRLQDVIGNIGIGKTDASATEKLDVNGRIKSKAIVLQENSEALPYQITYENRKFYGTDSTGGKRMFQFADYQAWLDTVNGMTDAQKTEWKTAMNGGWTTNTMSVVAVSPKVVKNSNLPTYITIEGANLNLNPTNFSLKLVDAITGIETVVPNSQVQLQTNGLSLIFWFNFSTLPIADYYIRLDNGVAILTTNSVSSIMVRDTVQNIDLSLLTWSRVCVTPAEIDNTLITGVNSFIFRQNANNTPLVGNNASVIAAAKSSQILSIGGNLVISGNIQIKAQNSVYNGFILGLAKSSISTQLVDITDASIGFTADGSNWLNISKIINNVKSTLPSISLTSSTNLNLGFTIVKQGNVISITWRYTDQYNNTTSATVNKTITDTNYSLYLVGTSGNITGDNTIIINDIYKF